MADFDMDPDAVTQSINRLRGAGDGFGSAWEKRKQALQSLQAAVGTDPIAQAFLEKYTPFAERLTARADNIPVSYGKLCDDAMCCVDDYRGADAQGAGAVNGLTNMDLPDAP